MNGVRAPPGPMHLGIEPCVSALYPQKQDFTPYYRLSETRRLFQNLVYLYSSVVRYYPYHPPKTDRIMVFLDPMQKWFFLALLMCIP